MANDTPDVCPECKRPTVRWTRSLCHPCYMQHWKNGTHTDLPKRERPPAATVEKPCAICLVVKPLGEFGANRHRSDGRGSYCRPCAKSKYQDVAKARNGLVPQHFDGEQECRKCKATKSVSEFNWRTDSGRYSYTCKACRSGREKVKNALTVNDRRAYNIWRKYGLTSEDFSAMLAAQGGGCAICGSTENPDAANLAVDHDHATGRVRGLLCGPCNKGIGLLRDDLNLLREAVRYLETR
jgi:hypothetical protein